MMTAQTPGSPAPPTREALDALAGKYRALLALRTRRDEGGAPATRAELRTLAARFPGCLRELDTLGRDELGRRATATSAAATGGAREPWMDWIAAYHALMSDALAARARGEAVDAPEGRLNVMVLRALAVRFGVEATTIAETLFPLRRPSPYRL
jgi:hypothetical protein